MASINNIKLELGNGSSERPATVSGTLDFDAGDVGKTYRLSIDLWGEDLPGDNVPASDPPGDDLLYSFLWIGIGSSSIQLLKKYRTITVSAPGSTSFSETRNVPSAKLDEDSGKIPANPPLPGLPRSDEVYARVTLTLPPATARSSTVSAGFGV